MADTKQGRDKQARDAERRQREREIAEEQARGDEPEPEVERDGQVTDRQGENGQEEEDRLRTCHRRGCEEPARFVVIERYLEETGHGAVEATAHLCTEHTREESPTNLDGVYEDYVFRVIPIPQSDESDAA